MKNVPDYDEERVKQLKILYDALKGEDFPTMEEPNQTEASFRNFAFFESYFSNYKIRTETEIENARKIIETEQPVPVQEGDTHDILGTYKIVSNRQEMRRTPHSCKELFQILQDRHRILMAACPTQHPGVFKQKNNFAGDFYFVDYTQVKGTLTRGFEFYQALELPFARALFMLYMVLAVHPFIDGNGRLSRIMMNAELVAANQSKVIIPWVFRGFYGKAVQRLSREGEPEEFIQAFSRVRRFSATITGESFDATRDYLEKCNAFRDFQTLVGQSLHKIK